MEMAERIRTARTIRESLRYLLKDASEAELTLVSLHLRIAILEAEDFLTEATGETPEPQESAPGARSEDRQASA